MIFTAQRRHRLEIDHTALERKPAVVDEPLLPLRARDRHLASLADTLGRIVGPDHGRHTQLAGDDRGVTGPPAAVSDDRRGPLHDGFPIGVGHVRDQHLAGLKAWHVLRAGDDTGAARTDTLPDAPAAHQHRRSLLQGIPFQRLSGTAAFHRFRACLKDIQPAVAAISGPFDIHRATVMRFDPQGVAGQLMDFRIAQREAAAFRCGDFHDARRFAFSQDHLHGFIAEVTPENSGPVPL